MMYLGVRGYRIEPNLWDKVEEYLSNMHERCEAIYTRDSDRTIILSLEGNYGDHMDFRRFLDNLSEQGEKS